MSTSALQTWLMVATTAGTQGGLAPAKPGPGPGPAELATCCAGAGGAGLAAETAQEHSWQPSNLPSSQPTNQAGSEATKKLGQVGQLGNQKSKRWLSREMPD